jgi:hypothetical protein
MHTLATGHRPAIEATATSNDPESVASTQVARQVLDYDLDEGALENALKETHWRALPYGEGYLVQTWDFHRGELIGTRQLSPDVVDGDEGLPPEMAPANGLPLETAAPIEIPVREGAVRCDVRSPFDVARDLDLDRVGEHPWHIVRTRVNRWELAARFPEDEEMRRMILGAPSAESELSTLWAHKRSGERGGASDYVHMLTLYHQPTDAMPAGRLAEIVGEATTFDGPYPYDHCVVHGDVPSAEIDRAVGYGEAWDLLALSQVLDAVESGMLNVADHATLIRWKASRGSNVQPLRLDTGMTACSFQCCCRGHRCPGLRPGRHPEAAGGLRPEPNQRKVFTWRSSKSVLRRSAPRPRASPPMWPGVSKSCGIPG